MSKNATDDAASVCSTNIDSQPQSLESLPPFPEELNSFPRPFSHVLSATRLHFPESETTIPNKSAENLRNYVASVRRLQIPAAIAVKSHADEVQRICAEEAPDFHICVLKVPCWGAFVPALNALLGYATSGQKKFKYILYQSLETTCSCEVLQTLLDNICKSTLVVGPVLNGHDFQAGEQILNGRTTPWNTLALWNVRMLSITGFLQIAEGLPGIDLESEYQQTQSNYINGVIQNTSVPAGVEEVTAIALIQNIRGPERARAVLLKMPSEDEANMSWRTDWGNDDRRRKWHEEKMRSKVSRPKQQLQAMFRQTTPSAEDLKIESPHSDEEDAGTYGIVTHIDLADTISSEATVADDAFVLKTKIKQAAFSNNFEELDTLLKELRALENVAKPSLQN